MHFEPIAIVGQSCTLPEALTPAELWANVLAGRNCLSRAPEDRWGMAKALAMGTVEAWADSTWSDVGGYVNGFSRAFDPTGFALPADEVRELDPVFQMVLHGAREALRGSGHDSPHARTGLVLGNLSFPSVGMARYAESVWLEAQGPDLAPRRAKLERPAARNRFNSGLPAHLAARALGLGAGAFALDAACASSLYAIKLACDRLHDRTADVMVAGAVNQADDLFIHIGFCALSAMSKSGRSRPFHRDADGLVPAEGTGFVVLQRLSDAVASGRTILGVIRGVGLSNDGRGRGLLAPSEEGQERAMRGAYAGSGLSPADISLVECHATGTPVGDATELRSMARVFAGCDAVAVGSLKSNLGHLITAAGVAGLLKVLAAMKSGQRPPGIQVDAPLEALQGTPFRLLRDVEPWNGPRRAAINAFGFGGNNACLLVEAFEGRARSSAPPAPEPVTTDVAIVGVGARVADGDSAADFARLLFSGESRSGARESVDIELDGLKFPPSYLTQTLAQQTLVLEAAREATLGLSLPRERTSVLVGMGCDPEVARYGARWRLKSRVGEADPAWLSRAQDELTPVLQAAGVIGTMPNIPANRINSQLDLAGPAFTVSSEEASGITALDLAARALRAGECDAALVGAVDLSHELVHQTALKAVGREVKPGDAAVVLVLKRLADARRDGNTVYAVLDAEGPASLSLGDTKPGLDLGAQLGAAHAANGLVHVAAAALSLHHGARPRAGAVALPWFGERIADVEVSVLEAPAARARLRSGQTAAWLPDPPSTFHVFSGADKAGVLASLASAAESNAGPARLVLVAANAAELSSRAEQARRWLESGGPPPEGVAFRETPIAGQLAFVFTGAAAAYPGMGRELSLAFPELVANVAARCTEMKGATDWLYGEGDGQPKHPLDQLWGTSFVCQLHAELTRRVLGLKPQATLGYSSGESNALFAMGAWNDLGEMMRESRAGSTFTRDLVAPFEAPRRAWSRLGVPGTHWSSFIVSAPVEQVKAALASEPLCHLTIVNTPEDCVIGGEAKACERVVERLGRGRALPLGYDMAAHCPEVEEIREAWWKLHHRATTDVPGVRFYSNATGSWFRPTAEAAADAITGQALRTMDFTRTVEQAWADGVRVFIEHGPRGLCSGWIRRILGDREHLVVPLDVAGRSGVRQLMNGVAWLIAAGVEADVGALEARLAAAAPRSHRFTTKLTLPAHPKVPTLPRFDTAVASQVMARAPVLVPVLEEQHARVEPLQPPHAEPPRVNATVTAPKPTAPPVTALEATTPVNDSFSRLAAQHAQLGAVHREFLAQQAKVHERFLALQKAAADTLLRAYGGAPQFMPEAGPSLEAPVTSPPAAPAFEPVTFVPPGPPVPVTVPVPASAASTPVQPALLPGPKFDRAQLEVLASGKISSVFGARFEGQDGYARQVRMPEPPLLLADRVTGIDAVPGSMQRGTLWTETDVRADSWYLNDEGRMPAGVMIEAGQADLLLISWLGVDALNRGERVYRLLGCELTYHGGLPVPGDTLAYDIHVDGHAKQGEVRLFFFHYDCKVRGQPRLSVRNGQAGFFTDEELAQSAGVLWDPADEEPPNGPLDAPAAVCEKRRFNAAELRAFASGRPYECFGRGWELTQPHVRSARITSGRMQFLDEVTEFDVKGGPWGRGYLRAETKVSPSDWFFDGHFKNDPCMPGTLMFEGCLQAMSIYLAALGYTIERDGWRFEPVPDQKYAMRCRGQVTPQSKHLTYEVFVSEVSAGPHPTIHADLLCTVDGRKAFHAKRVGLRLVPDWPLEHWKQLGPAKTQPTGEAMPLRELAGLEGYVEPKPVATAGGFAFDYHSLLSCAWGPPSAAFGPFYSRFDGTRRAARLPGPPYHFMSRVTRVDGPLGGMQTGTSVEVEYDVPSEQWYFEQNGARTMPFCVVMEAALQPCGWLASYVGSALTGETDMLFRNLDGSGTLFEEIRPAAGPFRTKVKLLSVSRSAGMIIESFAVECFVGDKRVYEMNTVFGFFPKEAFENQVGLPVTDDERARLAAPGDRVIDLTSRPAKYFRSELRLAGEMLLMLDRVTGFWPEGGKAGLGYVRAEKSVDPDEWFFKAHFFQDPVQPGSLGIEALCQLLQFFMLEKGMGDGLEHPRFESLMLERPVTWKYRGQVVPKNRIITTELQITEVGEDEKGRYAIAEGWLWVDGKRIYSAKNLGMRIVPGSAPGLERTEPHDAREELLDPATAPWLADHCPTWTLPALPMMSMVDRLVEAAARQTGRTVTSMVDVQLHRWLPFPGGPVRLRTEVAGEKDERTVTLLAWREANNPALSRFEPVATGRARFGPAHPPPSPFPPLTDLRSEPVPYASGKLFHGPAFQYLTGLRMGATGSSAVLRAESGSVPRGALGQGLLDAATHGIPHDELWRWSSEIPRDHIAYPYRISEIHFLAPLPDAGELRVETRFSGFDGQPRFPVFDVQIFTGQELRVAFRLVEVLLPRGPLGAAPPGDRRSFLKDRRYVPGVALSEFEQTATRLHSEAIRQSDWLPGNVATLYGVPPSRRGDLLAQVAVREHVARRAFVHPSTVIPEETGARAAMRPLRLYPLELERLGESVEVVDTAAPVQDLAPVRAYWRERLGVGEWLVEDLYYGLVERFVGDVVLANPAAFASIKGRSCLYLANHQVGVESLLFSMLASALSGTPTVTLAKAEHRTSWLGTLIAHNFAYPGVVDPKVITFFDRDDKESLLEIVGELAHEMQTSGKSVMVHVEGTRSLSCRQPVVKMSSAFIDMALAVGAPIVPVRFVGGLPIEPLSQRLEFPLGFGRQDYWIGAPILPEQLAALPFKERKLAVIAALNHLGPDLSSEQPMPADPEFEASVEAWTRRTGATYEDAVLFTTLASRINPGSEARELCEAARAGRLVLRADERSQWLGRLAQRLFGPRGPAVVGLK